MRFLRDLTPPATIFDKLDTIINYLPTSIVRYLEKHNCFLGGGTFVSLYHSLPINDLDIYIPMGLDSLDLYNLCIKEGMGNGPKTINAFMFKTSKYHIPETPDGRINIQIITNDNFRVLNEDIEGLLQTFDFKACMVGYSFKTKEYIYSLDGCKDLFNKKLTYNIKASNPKFLAYRLEKYLKKGFYISVDSLYIMYFKLLQSTVLDDIQPSNATIKYIKDLISCGADIKQITYNIVPESIMYS